MTGRTTPIFSLLGTVLGTTATAWETDIMVLVQVTTSPTSTRFGIRTPVRERLHRPKRKPNCQRQINTLGLQRNTSFSWNTFKSEMTEPVNTLMSNAKPWQMALAEETSILSIKIPVSEKNLRSVKKVPRKKTRTQAIAPLTS